ncbi:class II aldolase/adducin family protein [Pseudomonas schmalbachii]|uniref:Class II aldolase/adducin family protein n=1 Tax=Pseudomonas schmalbachii TaxID=2816993 RepID=A0ABS3TUA1_9PSED|nr:class II aldolase/adducin family protein [Pseudomonas schmalbachii]MBO3276953.1 class II aldolase/adducin family protein [Pseudomonas schmalbachii]
MNEMIHQVEVTTAAPDAISPAEREARVQLAALYRALHAYGMTDLIYNHITLRVPGEPEHILLNPFGMLYKEITASSLYKIHLNGEQLYKPDDGYAINPAAYVIHTAVHAARPDAHCVIHTHSRAGSAVSAMACGLLPVSQHSHMFHGRIGYHDFSGPVVDLAQQAKLVEDLGDHDALIMRNHGLMVCGQTVAEAFFNIYWLESACRIQVDAMAAGELTMPSAEALEVSRTLFASIPNKGVREWAAVMRELERNDPSFRD